MKNIPKKQFAGWMLMLLLCISISAFAQSPKKVTGRVMDAQGELLIGVNVTEAADPSNGVVTDINGTYTITLKGNKPSLKFSYIGFKDKVVAVGSKGVLDVALEEDVAALDEVVVGLRNAEESFCGRLHYQYRAGQTCRGSQPFA